VDLSRAESAYKQALAHDPTQVTALTRLSAITFSRGVYSQALAYAQRAWEAGYQDRVTRLVLGDALVANGALAQGAEIVEDVEWAESRLLGQAWYKYWSHADYRRAADAWRVVMRVNPEEQDRTYWIQRAEKAAAES
jgi:cytochrome c-type biogenesis protein CcmH/NrfG